MRKTMQTLSLSTTSIALLSIAILFALLGCSEIANLFNNVDDNDTEETMYDYVCENGEPDSGSTTAKDTTKCTSCDSGYLLVNSDCEVFGYASPLALSGTAHANGATLAITPTHSGTLHWVVYM